MSILKHVGFGPFPIWGEKAREQRAEKRARRLLGLPEEWNKMNPLTLEQARALAKQEVDRMGPDFRYADAGSDQACFYVPITDPRTPIRADDDPPAPNAELTGCLVGSIISAAGLMTDDIARSITGIDLLITRQQFAVEGKYTSYYLSVLQTEQDAGSTWGEAYEAAEKMLVRMQGDDND